MKLRDDRFKFWCGAMSRNAEDVSHPNPRTVLRDFMNPIVVLNRGLPSIKTENDFSIITPQRQSMSLKAADACPGFWPRRESNASALVDLFTAVSRTFHLNLL
jgi:hypothetical protein